MTCSSSSSNILGNTIVNSIQAIGSRLVTILPNDNSIDGGCEADLQAGDVIRYDISSSPKLYVKALADVPENAEVIGVVESIDTNNVTVVISGQITYPIAYLINDDATGGAGGNDIYFLSSTVAGKLQNVGPSTPGEIIKPVMQVADNGIYNGIIHNYVGYQVGGSIVTELTENFGEMRMFFVPSTQSSPDLGNGFINVSESVLLSTTEYSGFYNLVGRKYGYKAKVTFNSSSPVPLTANNKIVSQKQGNVNITEGNIQVLSSTVAEITVTSRNSVQSFSAGKKLFIDGKQYTPETISVTHFYTPKITIPQSSLLQISGYGGSNLTNSSKIVVGLRVKNVIGINIPTNVTVNSMHISGMLSLGTDVSGVTDVSGALSKTLLDLRADANKFNRGPSALDASGYIKGT